MRLTNQTIVTNENEMIIFHGPELVLAVYPHGRSLPLEYVKCENEIDLIDKAVKRGAQLSQLFERGKQHA